MRLFSRGSGAALTIRRHNVHVCCVTRPCVTRPCVLQGDAADGSTRPWQHTQNHPTRSHTRYQRTCNSPADVQIVTDHSQASVCYCKKEKKTERKQCFFWVLYLADGVVKRKKERTKMLYVLARSLVLNTFVSMHNSLNWTTYLWIFSLN